MQLSPKVSICCRTYNHEKFIGQAIESVLAQTFQDWELIISDDCSEDNTLEIIKQFQDPRVKILTNQKNIGVISNLNKVISYAKGSYIAIFDGDDIYFPEKIQKQVTFLDNNPDYGAVFSYIDFIGINNDIKAMYTSQINNPSGSQPEMLSKFFYQGNFLAFPTEMFRREFTFIFPESLIALGDCNFHINTLLKTKIKVLEEPLVKYRISDEQVSNWRTIYSNKIEWMLTLDAFLKLNDLDLFKNIFQGRYEAIGEPTTKSIPYFLSLLAKDVELNNFWGMYLLANLMADKEYYEYIMDRYNLSYVDYLKIKYHQNKLKNKSYKKQKKVFQKIILVEFIIIICLFVYLLF